MIQEKAEKEKLEQDFMKQMDAWKAEQLERHKVYNKLNKKTFRLKK